MEKKQYLKKTQKFHQRKRLILINNIDINKIVVSNKVSLW